jgi:hypothetical protein
MSTEDFGVRRESFFTVAIEQQIGIEVHGALLF